MANYSAAARTRALLAGRLPGEPSSPHRLHPWTEANWRHAQRVREAVDNFSYFRRWQVTVLPSDGVSRYFFFRGALEDVQQRATNIFGHHTQITAIEPAASEGAEDYDSRLCVCSFGEGK